MTDEKLNMREETLCMKMRLERVAWDAMDHIDALEAKLRESALSELSALGQASEAYTAQLDAEAKLAKAMEVVEMLASADVDAVLSQAIDISCEILAEMMEDENDDRDTEWPDDPHQDRRNAEVSALGLVASMVVRQAFISPETYEDAKRIVAEWNNAMDRIEGKTP